MKKLLFAVLLLVVGYKYLPSDLSFFASAGAFDKSGQPLVVLFIGPNCGAPCDTVQSTLKERGVSFQEINVAGADGAPVSNKYGVNRYPVTLIGKQQIDGDDILGIGGALAEAYGPQTLPRMQRAAMANHFDANGRAKVIMYGTSWCPYCKQQREFFAANGVQFDDVDVEASRSSELAYQSLQGNGYPLTYVGYRRFSGYKEQEILEAISQLKKAKPKKAG
jgi:glutaredoxin